MHRHGIGVINMTEPNNDIALATERYERRLGEECGKLRSETNQIRVEMAGLRVEMADMRVEMAAGFGEQRAATAALRAEMIDRIAELLKWQLVFGATIIAAVAGLLVLLR